MSTNLIFPVKEVSVCLNAANLWLDTWKTEGSPDRGKMKRIYLKEIRTCLRDVLSYLFGKEEPPIRQDLNALLSAAKDESECEYVIHKFMVAFIYIMASNENNYVAVNNRDYKFWRKEEDAIVEHDPTDLIFL